MTGWAADPWLLTGLANHLWQSTMCLGLAACLAWLLRRHDARWRHRVWLAASMKFLVPWSLFVSIGGLLPHAVVSTAPAPEFAAAIQMVGEPFSTPVEAPVVRSSLDITVVGYTNTGTTVRTAAAATLWMAGAAALFALRFSRWHVMRRQLRASAPLEGLRERRALELAQARLRVRVPLTLVAGGGTLQPGVVGVARPAILWPIELSNRLSDAELDAIMAHEVAHVRRRDNLFAALHRLVELVFWFYPVVWWLDTRLLRERERACDEAVLATGHDKRSYARGILKVSRFCLKSAPHFVTGIAGSSLARRVEDIMSGYSSSSLGAARRALLVLLAFALIAGPIGVGYVQAAPGLPALSRSFGNLLVPALGQPIEPPPAQASTGRVSGVVTDQRGEPIAGATLTLVPQGVGTTATLTTGEDGTYSMDLPPAQYELTVGKPGFRSSRGPLFATRGDTIRRNIQLQIGAVSEAITITGQTMAVTDLLDLARTHFEQGRFAQAESTIRLALARLSAESAARTQQARARAAAGPSNPVRVAGEIREPRKIHDVRPVYPQRALDAQAQGIVIMEATIDQDGNVADAKILRGHPLLNQAALDAVSLWKFTPTLLNGAPVEVVMTVTVNFTLQ